MSEAAAAAASRASDHPSVQKFARHVNPAFVKLLGVFGYGRLFTRAKGCTVWDHEGREYLDCLAGFGAVSVGHNHPRILARARRFLDEDALNLVHVGPSGPMADLAERLCAIAGAPLSIALLSSSGAEAVEAGLKLARAATGRPGIVFCEESWHGQNLGALSVMGQERMRKPFAPLLPDARRCRSATSPPSRRALGATKAGAFVVEPIQCEGGVVLPPHGYLRAAQDLCRKKGALLVLDEVATGLGRTGAWFAFQREGFTPDVLCVAKALSGGLAAVAATLTSAEINERAYGPMDRFDLHGSTFGGNSLSCAVALETLAVIEEERLCERAEERGRQLLEGLQARLKGHPLVREVRGRGLLVGVALGATGAGLVQKVAPFLVRAVARNMLGQWAVLKLLERGVIAQPTLHGWDVIRLEPPLTISPEEVRRAVDEVGAVLDRYEGVTSVVADVVKRVGRQGLEGWSF